MVYHVPQLRSPNHATPFSSLPSSTRIIEDNVFVESKLHLELDHTKAIGHGLSMPHAASRIAEGFKTDSFVLRSANNTSLRQLGNTTLDSVSSRGVKGIERVFPQEYNEVTTSTEGSIKARDEKEQVLETETDGLNLKVVVYIEGVDFQRMYSNSCVEIPNIPGIEAARAATTKGLRKSVEFGGSYVNYQHLALLCDLMTHQGSLTVTTWHRINRTDTRTLMRCSFKGTVETLMEAAAVGEKDDCHGIAENMIFGQVTPIVTGSFDTASDVDMPQEVIVDHRLPTQNMFAAQEDHGMAPAQVATTPYDSNSPMWPDTSFRAESVAFSLLAVNSGDDSANLSYLGFCQSPKSTGGMSPAPPTYSPSSPDAYSPTPPHVPARSPYQATPPFMTSSCSGSPFFDHPQSTMSPTYSPTSPAPNRASPNYPPLTYLLRWTNSVIGIVSRSSDLWLRRFLIV